MVGGADVAMVWARTRGKVRVALVVGEATASAEVSRGGLSMVKLSRAVATLGMWRICRLDEWSMHTQVTSI